MSLSVTIPGEALSLNHAYRSFIARGRIRRALTSEGAAYKQHVAHHVRLARATVPPGPLALTVHLYGHWETRGGQPRRRDVSNCLKLAEDALCEALGIDDRRIRAVHAFATHDSDPRICVRLEAL